MANKGWRAPDRMIGCSGVPALPQLTPYLLSSVLSWVTTWCCTVATWTPPTRPPPPPPPLPATLKPGCSASEGGGGGWGSSCVGVPASRGGNGGWKVGEVSGDCFLFKTLVLRGAGSGCLLTGLGRGGEGRVFRRANHRPSDKSEGARDPETEENKNNKQKQTNKNPLERTQREQWEMLRCRDRKRRYFLSGTKPVQKEEPKEDIKPHEWPLK